MVDEQPAPPFVRPYVLAGQCGVEPVDPGPVPPEPRPSTMVLPVDAQVTLGVTRNVGYTGRTGLTVVKGETTVTVALPAATVSALRAALCAAAVSTGSVGGRG